MLNQLVKLGYTVLKVTTDGKRGLQKSNKSIFKIKMNMKIHQMYQKSFVLCCKGIEIGKKM